MVDKWKPTIWWEGRFQKLHLVIGPEPELEDQQQNEWVRDRMDWVQGFEQTGFPEIYKDLVAVFNEEEYEVLPSHRATDCAIVDTWC